MLQWREWTTNSFQKVQPVDEAPELSLVNVGKAAVAIVAFVLVCGILCAGLIYLLTSGQNAAVNLIRRLRRTP